MTRNIRLARFFLCLPLLLSSVACEDKPDLASKPLAAPAAIPGGKDPLEDHFGNWRCESISGEGASTLATQPSPAAIMLELSRGKVKMLGLRELTTRNDVTTLKTVSDRLESKYALVGLEGGKVKLKLDDGQLLGMEARADGKLNLTDGKRSLTLLFVRATMPAK